MKKFGMVRNPNEETLRQQWETPPDLFAELHSIFHFTVDAFADDTNTKLPRYWDECRNEDWRKERVFANPPFTPIEHYFYLFPRAEVAVVIAPVTSLATKYCHESPPDYVFLPSGKIPFVRPKGLKVNSVSPTLATVILAYGNVSDEVANKVCDIRSVHPFVVLRWK